MISHPLSRNTLLNSGYVLPYYDVNDAEKCYPLSRIIMVLVVSSTNFAFFWDNPHLYWMWVLPRGEYLLASQLRIPLIGRLVVTQGDGQAYLKILDSFCSWFVAMAFVSTRPDGGFINRCRDVWHQSSAFVEHWNSTLVALACQCVNKAYQSSLLCRHWHGHPGSAVVLH